MIAVRGDRIVATWSDHARGIRRARCVLDAYAPRHLLVQWDRAMSVRKASLRDSARIEVHPGPGRFRIVRTAVVVAQALAWALGIPTLVRGKRTKRIIPRYDAPPSIAHAHPRLAHHG